MNICGLITKTNRSLSENICIHYHRAFSNLLSNLTGATPLGDRIRAVVPIERAANEPTPMDIDEVPQDTSKKDVSSGDLDTEFDGLMLHSVTKEGEVKEEIGYKKV